MPLIFPYIGNVIIPTEEHIFQRGRYQVYHQLDMLKLSASTVNGFGSIMARGCRPRVNQNPPGFVGRAGPEYNHAIYLQKSAIHEAENLGSQSSVSSVNPASREPRATGFVPAMDGFPNPIPITVGSTEYCSSS